MEPEGTSLTRPTHRGARDAGQRAKIIDGNAAAAQLRTHLIHRVEELRERHGIRPALAVIRVGNDPASAIYVNNKIKACAAVGVKSVSA